MDFDAEKARVDYDREGYISVPGILDPQEVEELRSAIAELTERARSSDADNSTYDLETGHTAESPRLRRIKLPHLVHPAFKKFLTNKRLMSVLTPLLGENIRHQYVKLNIKSPDGGSPLEWHQDWAFYPHTNPDLLAVGLMLDDVTEDNGPTLVVPRSHRPYRVRDHHRSGYFVGAINPADPSVEFDKAVPLLGSAGTITVHHAFLVHGAARNHSAKVRRICFYEFMAADAFPLEASLPKEVQAALGDFDARIVQGKPTVVARLEAVPVRVPLPLSEKARSYGSIYRTQAELNDRYFA